MSYLIVFLGAGVGGALRHGVNLLAAGALGTRFPYGTLAVNVLGSLLMGIVAEWFALWGHLPQGWRLFLATGVLGGFTTFSAFSLDAAALYERGDLGGAMAYVAGSVVLSVGALFAAVAFVRRLAGT